jgi:hypothetical protein
MNARPLLIAGFAVGSGLALSACTTVPHDHTIAASAIAQDCRYQADVYVDRATDNPALAGKAPEIMTYDPSSHVETRLDSRGQAKVLTVQNSRENSITALGVDEAGNRAVPICTADGRDYVYTTYTRTGPNPVIVGTIAGAIVGGAVTKNGAGAATGAAFGGTFGSSLRDPYEANAISIGTALGSLVGYSVNGIQGASAGAAYGALLGAQTNNAGGATLRSDDYGYSRDGGSNRSSGGRGGGTSSSGGGRR